MRAVRSQYFDYSGWGHFEVFCHVGQHVATMGVKFGMEKSTEAPSQILHPLVQKWGVGLP